MNGNVENAMKMASDILKSAQDCELLRSELLKAGLIRIGHEEPPETPKKIQSPAPSSDQQAD